MAVPISINSVTDDVAPVTGQVTANGSTNDTVLTVKVTLDGTVVAGDTVQLYDQPTGSSLGSPRILNASDIAAGFVELDTDSLTDGTKYDIAVKFTDAQGNPPDFTTAFAVTADTTAPALSVTAPPATAEANSAQGAAVTFTASATDAVDPSPVVAYAEGGQAVVSGGTFALGAHTVVATATDAAGNTATQSFTFTVQDTTKPQVSASAPPTEEATSAAGAAVVFTATASDAADPAPAVTYAEGGQAVVSGDTFAIGTHTVTATAKDASGNEGTTAFTFKVEDTTAPKLSVTSAPPAKTEAASAAGAAVSFTASATDAVDGATPVTYAEGGQAVASGGTFALGTHTVVATSTDAAGNTATQNISFAVVDTTKPQVSVASAPPPTTEATSARGAAVNFAASATDAVDPAPAVTYAEGGRAVVPGGVFGVGQHTVTATATDASGNQGTTTLTFEVVDTTAPVLSVTSAPPATTEATSAQGAAVSFTASATDTADPSPAVLFAEGGNAVVSGGTFGVGHHTVTATARDASGNASTPTTLTFDVVDTTAPTLTAAQSASGLTNTAAVTITGTVSDLVGVQGVEVFDGDTKLGAAVVTGGAWSYTASGLAQGDHSFAAQATDAAGNSTNRVSAGPVVTVDTIAPGAPAITSAGGLTDQMAKTVTGTAEPGSTVTLYVTDPGHPPPAAELDLGTGLYARFSNTIVAGASSSVAELHTTTAGTDGGWSVDITLRHEGTYELSAVAQDAAGNRSASSPAVAYVLDTSAPRINAVAATPGAGELRAGQTVTLLLAASEAVAVDTAGGAPTLALNSGGTATFDAAASTPTSLAFRYTVQPGQNAADLAVTGLALNGATIRDAIGHDADLSGAAANPAGTLVVDTAAPAAPASLSLGAQAGGTGFVVRGAAEAGSTVAVFDGAASLGAVRAGSDGAWSLALPGGLSAGTHSFTAVATDAAGNASAASSSLPSTVRAAPPAGTAPATASFDAGARGVQVARTDAGDLVVTRGGATEVLRNTDELKFIDGRLVFDQDDTAVQVARLYRAALGRELDQGGLDFWSKAIERGASLSEIARGFLDSPEARGIYGADSSDAEFVSRLYRNVLGREGDAGGQAFWTGRLQAGASRAEVLSAVAGSAENKAATAAAHPGGVWDLDEGAAQVARLYDTVFGRLPDQGGLAFWAKALDARATSLQDLAARFMASPEYQTIYGSLSNRDFVQATYRNTLDRPGDAGGVAFWTARLDAGVSRASLVASFSESPEHVGLTAGDIMASAPGQAGIRLA